MKNRSTPYTQQNLCRPILVALGCSYAKLRKIYFDFWPYVIRKRAAACDIGEKFNFFIPIEYLRSYVISYRDCLVYDGILFLTSDYLLSKKSLEVWGVQAKNTSNMFLRHLREPIPRIKKNTISTEKNRSVYITDEVMTASFHEYSLKIQLCLRQPEDRLSINNK